VNRKIRAATVLAQVIAVGDENGNFGALRQMRQKFGIVIGDT
jgi:hypothetical protein